MRLRDTTETGTREALMDAAMVHVMVRRLDRIHASNPFWGAGAQRTSWTLKKYSALARAGGLRLA